MATIPGRSGIWRTARSSASGAALLAPVAPSVWAGQRYLVAAAAVVVQMALGAIYAWSVFRDPLVQAFGWSVSAATVPYTLNLLALGFAGLAGGIWMRRAGPLSVMLTAAVLYGGGVLLCGLAAHGLWVVYLGYGVLAGIGRGLAWVVPVATVVRWFPLHRGAMTGLAVAGNGLGALVLAPVATALIDANGVTATFAILGVAILAVLVLAALALRPPPDELMPAQSATPDDHGAGPDRLPPALARERRPRGEGMSGDEGTDDLELSVWRVLRTRRLYGLWALLLFNGVAGLGLASQAAPMAREMTGVTILAAASIVGAFSLASALGRFGCAWLSDLIGRRAVYTGMFVVQAAAFVALPLAREPLSFTALGMLVMVCFGGGVGTMPALATDAFGAAHSGEVMGMLLTAQGVGAIVGPLLLAGARDLTGSYTPALLALAAIMALGVWLPLRMGRPSPSRAPA